MHGSLVYCADTCFARDVSRSKPRDAHQNSSAARHANNGVNWSAAARPRRSDRTPLMAGPAASPNRFWNSDSTDAPVERSASGITSMAIAAAVPTLHVMMKPVAMIIRKCTSPDGGNEPPPTAKIVERIPARRLGLASEVASIVAFLASDEASYVSGSAYTVDGGRTAA